MGGLRQEVCEVRVIINSLFDNGSKSSLTLLIMTGMSKVVLVEMDQTLTQKVHCME
jgi:hypothetical protein